MTNTEKRHFIDKINVEIGKHKETLNNYQALLHSLQQNCEHDLEVIGHTHREVSKCKICDYIINS